MVSFVSSRCTYAHERIVGVFYHMERNGDYSCGNKTLHIDMRYFFIADQIKQKEVSVKYFPMDEMNVEYFNKPLQGALLFKNMTTLMNLED